MSNMENILCIDIGGSHIKGAVLNSSGEQSGEHQKLVTPSPATPESVLAMIQQIASAVPAYDKVSVGFPGYVRDGVVSTAPNLGTEDWRNFNLALRLSTLLNKPVKVVNDADLQGAGLARGSGLELVVTLGTGFGTALLLDGHLLPHLEIAHHPITKSKTYDQYIGEKALEEIGQKKWNKRMQRVIEVLTTVFQFDHLYISGGNASKISFPLAENISIESNKQGLKGGVSLWN